MDTEESKKLLNNSLGRLNAKIDDIYWLLVSLKKTVWFSVLFVIMVFFILLVLGLFVR